MSRSSSARLAAMMFLNYVVWGTWYTTIDTWLTATLHFTGTQAGSIFGTTALASMISPFLMGYIADRYFSAERLLALLHLVGAVILYCVGQSHTFGVVYGLMLLYCTCFFPTIPLTNSIAFRHISNPATEFPLIRVFATIGWIVISLVIGGLHVESASTQFLLGSGLSLVMSLYCLTLPHTPPAAATAKRTNWRQILGLDAVVMLKNRSYLVFLISSILACIPITFYFSFTNVYLNAVGWPNPAGKMSLGQASEVIMMLLMPVIYRRFSIKTILACGLLAWAIRYSLFAFGNPGPAVWMFYAAILLHGVCFDFFTVTGQLYTDQEAPVHLRSTAQGFLTFLTYGVGMFLGSMLSGTIVDFFTTTQDGTIVRNWRAFWLTSSIGSFAICVLVLVLFRARKVVHSKTEVLDDAGNYLPAQAQEAAGPGA